MPGPTLETQVAAAARVAGDAKVRSIATTIARALQTDHNRRISTLPSSLDCIARLAATS